MLRRVRFALFNSLVIMLMLSACQPAQPAAPAAAPVEEATVEATEAPAEEATEEATEEASEEEDATPEATEEPEEEAAAGHTIHWTYTGEEGADNWSELSEDYALCGNGHEQSPIDLVGSTEQDLPDIIFNYQPSALNIFNNGHTVQVNYDPGSTMEVDGVTYELKQFHFHAQSEHTVDGIAYPLELHLVHATPEGNLAVVGIMLEPGEENAAFVSTLENAPSEASEVTTVEGATVNALDLLPTEGTYYSYSGSLTTPPCSEGVKWHVMTTPIQMSQAQLDAMATILHGNFRPVQSVFEREIEIDSASVATH